MDVMLKCNRLAKLTKDPKQIADALSSSSLIQVSDDATKIRRNPEIPLPENSLEYWQGLKKQSVYIVIFSLIFPLLKISVNCLIVDEVLCLEYSVFIVSDEVHLRRLSFSFYGLWSPRSRKFITISILEGLPGKYDV